MILIWAIIIYVWNTDYFSLDKKIMKILTRKREWGGGNGKYYEEERLLWSKFKLKIKNVRHYYCEIYCKL